MTGLFPVPNGGRVELSSGDGGLPDVYPGRWTITVDCAPGTDVPGLLAAAARYLAPAAVRSCGHCGRTLLGVVCADCGTRAVHSNGHE